MLLGSTNRRSSDVSAQCVCRSSSDVNLNYLADRRITVHRDYLQLVCYSWITGISDVAIVAFVRKRVPEIQYLLATITDEQRREFGQVVEATVGQIEAAQFPLRPGIRFPQNGCVSCAHLGLCLGNQPLIDSKLIRQPGASDLDWLNVLDE